MLDRDVVVGHDDAFDEQADEALSSREVQLVQPRAHRGREGDQVVCQVVDSRPILIVSIDLLDTSACGPLLGIE